MLILIRNMVLWRNCKIVFQLLSDTHLQVWDLSGDRKDQKGYEIAHYLL